MKVAIKQLHQSKSLTALWLKPGDTVAVEIDGIGVLENVVQDEVRTR